MTSYRLTEPATEDLAEIMAWSEHKFGPLHAARYRLALRNFLVAKVTPIVPGPP
jgi:plasmid stabilization system protein ParE